MQSRDHLKTITVRNRCSDFDSYRAARVKSLFNAESGCNFNLEVNLDLSGDWGVGIVVGPSGSGKTSVGKKIFGRATEIHDYRNNWPVNKPIIDAINPTGFFDEVTAALAGRGRSGDRSAFATKNIRCETGETEVGHADFSSVAFAASPGAGRDSPGLS